jgi:hypothetical protein
MIEVTTDEKKLAHIEAQRDDYRETIHSLNNALWALLYPEDPQSWEYVTQPLVHLRIELEKMRNRIAEMEDERKWIREKLKLADDANKYGVFAKLHILTAHANGYERYIEAGKCDEKEGEIARQSVRIAELEELVHIPGEWKCPECKFRLSKRVLAVNDGGVYCDQREDVEGCPNDGMMMRRVTWKEDIAAADKAVEFWSEKANRFEQDAIRVDWLESQMKKTQAQGQAPKVFWDTRGSTLPIAATSIREAIDAAAGALMELRKQ